MSARDVIDGAPDCPDVSGASPPVPPMDDATKLAIARLERQLVKEEAKHLSLPDRLALARALVEGDGWEVVKVPEVKMPGQHAGDVAVQAAITAYERALWRPIAEAPRDGTRVLVKSGKWIGVAYWQKEPSMWGEEDVPCWAVFECDDCYYSLYLTEQNAPTHFRPLPTGPEGV